MRVLITNDDGITSPGLAILAHVAADAGHEVLVAPPNREYSGYSAGLNGEQDDDGELRRTPGRPPGLREDIEAMGVHASPALIAYVAGMGGLGPRPDLVLSGINLGPNVGPAILHSGTVGAALSAAAQGIPAVAFSSTGREIEHAETAIAVVTEAFQWVTNHPQDGRVLNINIPDVPRGQLRGLRTAPPARFTLEEGERERQVRGLLFSPFSADAVTFDPDSDAGLLARGWATATLLRSHTHDGTAATMPGFDTQEVGR
ncbi:5'/3'-nucleotidase SurE [Ruania halotolerans]|uniref:5'/3'-nucleotidase SurE n=1 Tax=Ruania halotolerans TaxID=2897773 RepID=UPI001E38FCE8|nr:5'/3'-nucleotidase SurE [Ruania halotolerans]UFU05967.1 5'/3'-nucleotidase SurE [Ruania halotolerans]